LSGKVRDVAPENTLEQFLAVARVVKPQGRRGEVVADILTDFPERFEKLKRAFLEDKNGGTRPVEIENTWPHKGRIVLKFSGVDSINQADPLRGLHVFIRREDRVALPDHQYYVWELEGCRVIREAAGRAQEVGVVTGIDRTGGVDLLRVARAGNDPRELLIPLTQDICTRIDTAEKKIVIDPPEDLLELNQGG
jgi:16S rRNA processing protein RimM